MTIRALAADFVDIMLSSVVRRLQKGLAMNNVAVDQRVLSVLYKQYYHSKFPPLTFRDVGFRSYSQHEEDGIILFIFSLIGPTNKTCVEICCGDGIECNTSNLIINHRWIGLLCDGNGKNIERAIRFYESNPDTRYWPPNIVKQWITKGNVNQVIQQNGFNGEVDLLSLDMDGVDYWVWEEISCISPRVVVLEFNHLWGADASVTIPYREDFVATFTKHGSDYAGASLNAFVKLSRKKGYRFVGTNAIATNAFFIRQDIKCDWLPEVGLSSCFDHPRAQFGMKNRLPKVREKEWVNV